MKELIIGFLFGVIATIWVANGAVKEFEELNKELRIRNNYLVSELDSCNADNEKLYNTAINDLDSIKRVLITDFHSESKK